MGKMYKNTLKLLLHTWSVSIPYVLLLVAENIFLFRLLKVFARADLQDAQPIYFLMDLNYLYVLGFLFFIFISYEFMRKSREANLAESMGKRVWLVDATELLVLLTLVILYAAIFLAYVMVGYLNLEMPEMCLFQLMKVLGVNIFLLSLASIGMGYLISKIPNRFVGYLVILFIVMLILPMNAKYFWRMQWAQGFSVYWLRDWIYLLPPDIFAMGDSLYGVPVELYRIATMLIWILIAVWLLGMKIWKYQRGKKQLITVVFIACIAVCAVAVRNKGSVLIMNDHPDSSSWKDQKYYQENNSTEKIQDAGFEIKEYDMELRFGRELSAVVKVRIQSEIPQSTHAFTLYHGYRISDIENEEGQSMKYIQEGDQVVVENPEKKSIQSLCFTYKGASPLFYSNKNACFLPGFFAYYPKAGIKAVYQNDEWVVNQETPADYRIHTSGLAVMGNLKGKGTTFIGKTTAVTLVGGNCAVQEKAGTRQIVYPLDGKSVSAALQPTTKEFKEEWQKLMTFLDISELPPEENKIVIMIPASFAFNSYLKPYYEFEDCILINGSNGSLSPFQVLETRVKAQGKEDIKSIFFSYEWQYQDVNEIEILSEQMEESELSDVDKLQDAFVLKMRECGVQYVAQATINYLMDDGDTRTPSEFLQSLQETEIEGGNHDKN